MATRRSGAIKAADERPRKGRKLYASRLAETGLPQEPTRPQKRQVRQFQLALLAANMAKAEGEFRPGDLVDKALRLWNAAGSALHVEDQAGTLIKGLLVFDREDWALHCRVLIASLNDAEGAQQGRGTLDHQCRAYVEAQKIASNTVYRAWKAGPERDDLLRALFPGQSETGESRDEKFAALCSFAKATLERGDTQPLEGKTGDPLSLELLHAWEPLTPAGGELPPRALTQAKMVVDGAAATADALIPLDPAVARWLMVLRQAQVSESKVRS